MLRSKVTRFVGGLFQGHTYVHPSVIVRQLRWATTDAAEATDVPDATEDERESMHFDVCVVGAGPAGLSAAIRFKQVAGTGVLTSIVTWKCLALPAGQQVLSLCLAAVPGAGEGLHSVRDREGSRGR